SVTSSPRKSHCGSIVRKASRAGPDARRPAARPEIVQKKYSEGRARTQRSRRAAQQLFTDRSGQPAFSAAIMLHVAKRFASRRRETEIKLLDVLVLRQVGRRPVHHNAAVLEDVAIIGEAQRDVRVLLREKEAHFLLLVQVANDLEY